MQTAQPAMNQKLAQGYAQEAASCAMAVGVMTAPLRTRPDEADNQDRLALAARRGIVQPYPIALMDRYLPAHRSSKRTSEVR